LGKRNPEKKKSDGKKRVLTSINHHQAEKRATRVQEGRQILGAGERNDWVSRTAAEGQKKKENKADGLLRNENMWPEEEVTTLKVKPRGPMSSARQSRPTECRGGLREGGRIRTTGFAKGIETGDAWRKSYTGVGGGSLHLGKGKLPGLSHGRGGGWVVGLEGIFPLENRVSLRSLDRVTRESRLETQ